MTVPERPRYGIRSTHPRVVPDGVRVTYQLVRINVSIPEIDPPAKAEGNPIFRIFPAGHPYRESAVVHPRVRWRMESDPRATEFGVDTITEGPDGTEYSWTLTFDLLGDHLITCEVLVPSPWASQPDEYDVFEWVQQVTSAALRIAEIEHRFGFDNPLLELLDTRGEARPRRVTDPLRDFDDYVIRPEQFLARVDRLIALEEHIEDRAPFATGDDADASTKARKRRRAYADALRKITWRDHGTSRSRIRAEHYVLERGESVERFIYISIYTAPLVTRFAEVGDDTPDAPGERAYFVTIVDWTDPLARGGSGIWRGVDPDMSTAIHSALSHWRSGNRYPKGTLVFDLPGWVDAEFYAADEDVPRTFETSGGTFIEDMSAWFDGAALVLGLAALVGLVLAPALVPVAGMLWAALAGSSGAAAIRLVDRRFDENLPADWKLDALDLLTIASNLCAVPGVAAAWRRGAQVMLPATTLGEGGVTSMVFIGQIVADGAQGILIATDGYAKIEAAIDDTSLTAHERCHRILTLLSELAVNATLIGVAIRGNVVDISGIDEELGRQLRLLEEPDARLDTTKPDASRGHTEEGDHEIEIHVDPPSTAPPVDPFPRLSALNEAVARGADDTQRAALAKMLDVDSPAVDLLMTKYALELAAHADAFVALWARANGLGVPPAMVRVYHEHTGLSGIDYLAGLHVTKPKITDEEVWAAMWATEREEMYRAERGFAGHSVARHGAHATDVQLTRRISTGVAPDEVVSHTPISTRFLTYAQWLTAHDAAFAAFRDHYATLGFDVTRELPRTSTGLEHCKVVGVFELSELVTRGFVGTGPHAGSGSSKTWSGQRELALTELADGKVQVKLGWTGSQWILIQLFGVPDAKPTGWTLNGPGSAI